MKNISPCLRTASCASLLPASCSSCLLGASCSSCRRQVTGVASTLASVTTSSLGLCPRPISVYISSSVSRSLRLRCLR